MSNYAKAIAAALVQVATIVATYPTLNWRDLVPPICTVLATYFVPNVAPAPKPVSGQEFLQAMLSQNATTPTGDDSEKALPTFAERTSA